MSDGKRAEDFTIYVTVHDEKFVLLFSVQGCWSAVG